MRGGEERKWVYRLIVRSELRAYPKIRLSQARNGGEYRGDATPLRCVADYEHFWERLLNFSSLSS